MAAPTILTEGTRVTKNGGTGTLASSVTCTIGDVIVCHIFLNSSGSGTIGTPVGWTKRFSNPLSGGGTYGVACAAFEKVAASTTETCTITVPGTDAYGYSQCTRLSSNANFDAVASISVNNGTGTATSRTITAAAPLAAADSLIITGLTAEQGGGGTNIFSTPAASSYTSIGTNPNDGTTIAYDVSQKTVATTTAPTAAWTWGTASHDSGFMLVYNTLGGGTDVTVTPSGFGLTMSLGTPSVVIVSNPTVTPAGFGLTMNLGTPSIVLITNPTVTPTGFGLTMSLGTPTVTTGSNPTITPTGFGLTMSLGTPAIQAGVTVLPNGFGLTMSLGSPSVALISNPTVTPVGFGLTMSLGTPSVLFDTKLTPNGFGLTMSLGTPSISAGTTLVPQGFGLTMSLGTPSTAIDSIVVAPVGFGLTMALGTPSITIHNNTGTRITARQPGLRLGLGLRVS